MPDFYVLPFSTLPEPVTADSATAAIQQVARELGTGAGGNPIGFDRRGRPVFAGLAAFVVMRVDNASHVQVLVEQVTAPEYRVTGTVRTRAELVAAQAAPPA
jgi:hypothetical protein